MDKDMTTYAMLSTACDGFDELSAYTPEKIEISALSVRWALQEHCTVATSEYKESLTAAYAIALMYRAGMVGGNMSGFMPLSRKQKANISKNYQPLIEAVIWRTMLRNHEDMSDFAAEQATKEARHFMELLSSDECRAANKYDAEVVEYAQALERVLYGKENGSELEFSAKTSLSFAESLTDERA